MVKKFLNFNLIKDRTLFFQIILKLFQFVSLYFFARILTTEELGFWAFFLVVTTVFTTLSGLGNNITLKSKIIQNRQKKQLIKVSILASILLAPLSFYYLSFYFNNVLVFFMCVCMIIEIVRVQLSIFEISKGNLLKGTILEIIPLLLAISFSILFQFIYEFSLESRVYGYTTGLFFSLIILIGSIKGSTKIKFSDLVSNISFVKYFYLLNIAVFLGIDKFFLKSVNVDYLGIYAVNLTILSSLMFFTKFVENKIISYDLNNYDKNLSTIIVAILSLLTTILLPSLFVLIGLSNFVLDTSSRISLLLFPIIMNEIGIRQNIIYKSSMILNKPLICISLANLFSIILILIINPSEYIIVKIYIFNLIVIMIILGVFSNRSLILEIIKKTKNEHYNNI